MRPVARIAPRPWMMAPATRAVTAALSAEGATVRFVGGCVRDAVLGRDAKDVDLATTDPPETVIALLEAAGLKAVPTGIAHGTVTAVVDGTPFEVTTLRRDVETDGRHAKVAFTDDWVADAARRDFTLNAMYCDADGTLFDPVGGIEDARQGRVRFVGDARARIEEDALRLLRFFRFHAHYGRGEADAKALAACRELAPLLANLSGERLRDETLKLLAAPEPAPVVALMIDMGVLGQVLPEVAGVGALAALCAIEGDAADPLRRLACLLRDGQGGAERVAKRLRLSNADAKRLAALATPAVALAADDDVRAQRRALYRVGRALFVDLVYLAWAAAPGDAGSFRAMLATATAWENPALPVKGADATALGVPVGPEIGRLLAAVEAWWQDGDYHAGRAEALETLKALKDAG